MLNFLPHDCCKDDGMKHLTMYDLQQVLQFYSVGVTSFPSLERMGSGFRHNVDEIPPELATFCATFPKGFNLSELLFSNL